MSNSQTTRWFAVFLVIAAAFYSILLCALQTAGFSFASTAFAAIDGLIVLSALALAFLANPVLTLASTLAIALNFTALALFSQAVDLKSVRDCLVIAAFFILGSSCGDVRLARRTFFTIGVVVVLVAAFEYAFPKTYVEIFNVLQFYLARGVIDPQQAQYVDTSLFVSGMRGDDRFLLPMLGPHRVSSIFLEPVSMGNFGAISLAWGLCLAPRHRWTAAAVIAIGLSAIILADARFAAVASVIFVLALLIPPNWTTLILAPAPIVAIGVLLLASTMASPTGDDLPSRLAVSGYALTHLSDAALLGLAPHGDESLDSGYTYVISHFGLPFAVLLWVAYLMLPAAGPQAQRFKLLFGLYICALLCVSGASLFALKTAALAWFILGATLAEERTPAWAPSYAPRHWRLARLQRSAP